MSKLQPNAIVVTMPTRGVILTEAQNAIDRELISVQQLPTILRTHDLPLPLSRNFLVESALQIPDWEYMLMVDDDVIMAKGTLKDMLKLDADVVSTNYPAHGKHHGKAVATTLHNKDGSIVFAGLGCVLVKRKVLETIPQPWFVATEYRVAKDKNGEVGFYAGQKDGQGMNFSAGEDTYFFLQARKHGFTIKETKYMATHARVDMLVTNSHTTRYAQQHVISKHNKVDIEIL